MTNLDTYVVVPISYIKDSSLAPSYAYKNDAGLDLKASCNGSIPPGERLLVPCGFAMALPENCAGLVIPRSGLAAKFGITVLNAPGLIDSSYRGEIQVCLHNTDTLNTFSFCAGDRIAQLLIVQYPNVELVEQEYLDDTNRGKCGFGSSGI